MGKAEDEQSETFWLSKTLRGIRLYSHCRKPVENHLFHRLLVMRVGVESCGRIWTSFRMEAAREEK